MGVNRFYKKGFLIAVYDEDDQLEVICDNTKEFAAVYGKSINNAKGIISKLTNGRQATFQYKDRNFKIILIPLDANEIKEILKGSVNI